MFHISVGHVYMNEEVRDAGAFEKRCMNIKAFLKTVWE